MNNFYLVELDKLNTEVEQLKITELMLTEQIRKEKEEHSNRIEILIDK